MRLLRWVLLAVAMALLTLSSCSKEATKTAEPSPSPVQIASPEPVESPDSLTLDSQELETTKQIFQQVTALEKQGRAMEALRTTKDPSKKKTCDNLMRQRQASTQTLRNQVKELRPSSSQLALDLATIDLNLCVSCSQSLAKPSCDKVRSSLKDAQESISSKS